MFRFVGHAGKRKNCCLPAIDDQLSDAINGPGNESHHRDNIEQENESAYFREEVRINVAEHWQKRRIIKWNAVTPELQIRENHESVGKENQ